MITSMTEPHRAVLARLSADFAAISHQLARVSTDLTELDRLWHSGLSAAARSLRTRRRHPRMPPRPPSPPPRAVMAARRLRMPGTARLPAPPRPPRW